MSSAGPRSSSSRAGSRPWGTPGGGPGTRGNARGGGGSIRVDERTYPRYDDAREPQDAADPHSLRDETAARWWDRLTRSGSSAAVTILLLMLGSFALVIFIYYFSTFFVTVLTDPWFQAGVGAIVVFLAGMFLGDRRRLSQLRTVHELTVKHVESGRAIRFRGEYAAGKRGYLFTPYKGTRGLLGQWEPLTKGDLVGDTINPHVPATILLPVPEFAHALTDTGEVGVMKVKRFAPLAAPGKANVRAVLPDDGAQDTIETARQELAKLHGDIQDYEEQLNAMETRLQNANDRAGRPHEQVREEALRWLSLAIYLSSGTNVNIDRIMEDTPGGVRDDMERLAEELEHED